jgi:hypothetical protein
VIDSHSAKPIAALGHRIRRRADLREQTRRRHRVDEVAIAALQHLRQHGLGRVDMRHHVDFQMRCHSSAVASSPCAG